MQICIYTENIYDSTNIHTFVSLSTWGQSIAFLVHFFFPVLVLTSISPSINVQSVKITHQKSKQKQKVLLKVKDAFLERWKVPSHICLWPRKSSSLHPIHPTHKTAKLIHICKTAVCLFTVSSHLNRQFIFCCLLTARTNTVKKLSMHIAPI